MIFSRTFEKGGRAFWKYSLLSITIRGLSILSRFFLIIYLGKFFSVEGYGVYGLLNSSLLIGCYLVGFDLYVFVTRELPKSDAAQQKKYIFNQFTFHAITYVILVPVFLLFLSGRYVPKNIIWLFGLLLILEQATQEFVRIFFALRYVVVANIVSFLRRTPWIIAFLVLSFFNENLLNIKSLVLLWLANHILVLAICGLFMCRLKLLPALRQRPDFELIRRMVRTSLVFFGSSISLQIMTYSNIYFLKYHHSSGEVGIFSFFVSILVFIDMFIHTTLVSIFLPRIIEARHNHDQHARLFKQMSVGIVLEIVAIAFLLALLIRPFLTIVGKDAFTANLDTFYILLAAYVLFGLSSIAHYCLYVNHLERFIFYSSLICCAVNLVLNYFLIPNHGVKGAAIALVSSMFILLALKALWGRSSWADDRAQARIGLGP